jgi:hypothetical protein
MKKSEREAIIAYHEAGHAVIARQFGLEVTSVTIIPDLDADTAGSCYAEWATDLALLLKIDLATQLSAIEKDVMVKLAGPIAECQYSFDNFDAATVMREAAAWSTDLKMAKRLVQMALELDGRDHSEYDELFGQLAIETECMVNAHWPAIERVAHGLLDFPTLNATDVDDLIGEQLEEEPEQWEEEPEQWEEELDAAAIAAMPEPF